MMKKVLLTIAAILIFLILLFLIVILGVFPRLNAMSKPSNLKKAKKLGIELLGQRNKNVVVVTAHPDDAEWYAGGTIIQLAQHNRVILVVGTSGEKGANVNNLGKLREGLQIKAAKIVGYKKVIFLHHPDRGLINNKEYRKQLISIFKQYKADIAFSFDVKHEGYVYRHSDHEAAGSATEEISKYFPKTDFYYFSSSRNNVIVDFTAAKKKKAAALKILSSYGSTGLISILRFLPFRGRRSDNFGQNQSFPKIGVKNGELFRLQKP
jgi:hypothetical protein